MTGAQRLGCHYRGFAVESATVQPETVAFISDLSGVIRSLTRHTDAELTHAWTEGHTLHQRVRHLDDQLGRQRRYGYELRDEQRSQLSVLTALQANTADAVAAAAATSDLATIKTKLATMEAGLQQDQLTMDNERRAGSGFRQSRIDTITFMTTVPVTPAQPPLGPVPLQQILIALQIRSGAKGNA